MESLMESKYIKLTKVKVLNIKNIQNRPRALNFFDRGGHINTRINIECETTDHTIILFRRKWYKLVTNEQTMYLLSKDLNETKYKIQIEVSDTTGTGKIFRKDVNEFGFRQIGSFDITGAENRKDSINVSTPQKIEQNDDEEDVLETSREASESEIDDYHIMEFRPRPSLPICEIEEDTKQLRESLGQFLHELNKFENKYLK